MLVRPRTMRTWLRGMVLACMLPAVAMAAFLIVLGYQGQRQDMEQGAVATARALMQAVDRELVGVQAALAILATAPDLLSGDRAGFHSRMLRSLPDMTFDNLVLTDTDARQLLNTLQPFGAVLPDHANPGFVRKALAGRGAVVSDLYIGGRAGQMVVAVAAPVVVDGRVVGVLSAGLFPRQLAEILRRQHLPDGWYASLVDSAGIIIARSSDHERLSGKPVSDRFREVIRGRAEGVQDAVSRSGEAVFASFSRSELSGWTLVIGIPQSDLTSDLQASLWLGIAVAGVLVLLGLAWAGMIGGHIGRAIGSLKRPALALASSHRPEVPASSMAEVAEVGMALRRAWDLLEQRSFERSRAEAESEAALRRLSERSSQLARLNAELEQFAYVTAHDLKSPLGVIVHLAGWIEQDIAAGAEQETAANLDLLRGRVGRMQSLLDGLLAYAQVGRGEECVETVDTGTLVDDIAEVLAPAGFTVACIGAMPMIHSDRAALRRLLEILITNAVQHHDQAGGRIEVSVRQHGGLAEFRVRDDGPGIAPRFHKGIFGIFQTLRSRDDMESPGVGLAIATKRVTAQGGRIWVESAPPARGAVFAFTWPIQDAPARDADGDDAPAAIPLVSP